MRPRRPITVRIANRLPFVRSLQARIAAERSLWEQQRGLLETERDELLSHCTRLGGELVEGHAREEAILAECERLREALYAAEKERDHLFDYCQKLNPEGAGPGKLLLDPAGYLLQRMRHDWDERARSNATYYTNSASESWDETDYFQTGEQNVREEILNDMENICQGDDPARMRVLEIGCGAGRMTMALSRVFGEVHAVDISSEMIQRAREKVSLPNVFFYQTSGMDLAAVPAIPFDFIFSYIVFQHISSKEVIESYVREAHRLLKPGRLFKFQVQGVRPGGRRPHDTWLGADFTRDEVLQIAERCGFEARYTDGAGTQYFWLWFFRK